MKLPTFYPDEGGDDSSQLEAAEESSVRLQEWPRNRGKADPPMVLCEGRYPGIIRAMEKIRTEYSRPLTVSSLARECGMSVRSLHRLYRVVTGHTVGKDLVARRLEAAAQMLREDDIKLEPVAMETGLRNAKNLCRLFKEHLGITPGQWKESFHGNDARVT